MTKHAFPYDNGMPNTSLFLEELSSIGQLFDCEIRQDHENIESSTFSNKASITFTVKDPMQSEGESKGVTLDINIQASDQYPKDLPIVKLTSKSLSEIEINELTKVLVLTICRLSGRCMLVDLIIFIEEWIKDNVFKTSQFFLSEFPENSVIYGQEISELSEFEDEEPEDHCFRSLYHGKFLDLKMSAEGHEALNLETCVYHHCGVCFTHGVRIGDNTASFFRVWKISIDKHPNDSKSKEILKKSLFDLMDEINIVRDVIHDNICQKTRAYVYLQKSFAYFFVATPLSVQYGLPLCSSLDSFWMRLSEKTVYFMMKQILEALHYLHRLKIVHHSVYPCNIRIMSFPKVILCDHGHVGKIWDLWLKSQSVDKKVKDQIEVHHFQNFSHHFSNDFAGDVFQYGLIVLSLCDCKIYNCYPLHIPQIFNQKLEDFIKKCIESNPKKRYTTHQLLQHPYMTNYRPTDSMWMGAERASTDMIIDHNHFSSRSELDSRLLKEFELIKVIGKGAFGVVVLAKNKIDNCIYAIKRITLNKRDWNERGKIMKEVQIMSRLTHPNIVRYYNSWLERQSIQWFEENDGNLSQSESEHSQTDEDSSTIIEFKSGAPSDKIGVEYYYPTQDVTKTHYPGIIFIYIQMEYCESKSLRYAIEFDKLYLNHERLWQFFRDICSGLSYLHSQGMIHRDIKPQNILITSLDHAKIVDFNLATRGRQSKPTVNTSFDNGSSKNSVKFTSVSKVGTAPYIAPEIEDSIDEKVGFTSKVDMYSFGIVFFEMCHPPFKTGMERHKVISKLKKRMLIPYIKDPKKQQIIRSLLQDDPKARLSADDLLMSSLYPVPLENNNLDKISQYISSEPFTTQSRKLLRVFFTHDEKRDVKNSYLERFYPQNIDDSVLSSFSSGCVTKCLNDFFKKKGCLHMKPPIFYPYHQKNVYLTNPSLCFVDHHGVRMSLSTTYLTYLYEFASNQPSDDMNSLPITRFGGVHDAFSHEQHDSFPLHPISDPEIFYATVCTSKNTVVFLTEVIVETYSLVSAFQIENLSSSSNTRYYHDVSDLAYDSNVVQRIELHINHSQLVLSIFGQIGLKNEDQTILLNRLGDIYKSEDEKSRKMKLEDFFLKHPKYRKFKPILIFLFTFEGAVNSLEERFAQLFRIKFVPQVRGHLTKIKSLAQSITSCNPEIDIKLTPYLFNSPIWHPDSFIYRYVGFQEIEKFPSRTITLSSGGIFRYHLENVKYHGYMAVGNHSEKHDACNHEYLATKDPRVAFSTMSYDNFVKLHTFLHFHRSCTSLELSPFSHDMILICYRFQEKNLFDFTKLHSLAAYLRDDPNNFSVYVYNHSLTYEAIRFSRDKYLYYNVSAVLCVNADDLTIKIFEIDKITFDDTSVKNIEEAAQRLKMLSTKRIIREPQTQSHKLVHHKRRDVKFVYVDNNFSNSMKKKLQATCYQKMKQFHKYFSPNICFIILIVNISREEYLNIFSDNFFTDFSNQFHDLSPKSSSPKFCETSKSIRDIVDIRKDDVVYLIFNTKNNQLKPIFN